MNEYEQAHREQVRQQVELLSQKFHSLKALAEQVASAAKKAMEEYDPEDGYTREDLRSFYIWEVDEMAEGIKLAIDTAIGFTESHVEDEVTYDLPF